MDKSYKKNIFKSLSVEYTTIAIIIIIIKNNRSNQRESH